MGKVILENNRVKNLQYISSVNIRVAHEIIGCADSIMQYITKNREVCHTLIISPPRCGKTTLIRDIVTPDIRWESICSGMHGGGSR